MADEKKQSQKSEAEPKPKPEAATAEAEPKAKVEPNSPELKVGDANITRSGTQLSEPNTVEELEDYHEHGDKVPLPVDAEVAEVTQFSTKEHGDKRSWLSSQPGVEEAKEPYSMGDTPFNHVLVAVVGEGRAERVHVPVGKADFLYLIQTEQKEVTWFHVPREVATALRLK